MSLLNWKRIASVLLMSVGVSLGQSEEEPGPGWTRSAVGNFTFSQTQFDNWTKGGEDSRTWQLTLHTSAVQEQKKTTWSNSLDLGYGMTQSGEQSSRKSLDEIKIESVFTYKIARYLNPFVAFTGETQLAPGYEYHDGNDSRVQISAFFDPAFFRQSAGLGYTIHKIFSTRLGGSLKETITRNYPVPYADDPDTPDIEKNRVEAGMESVSDLNWNLTPNTLLLSKLELFSNLSALDEIDVSWDTQLTTKISNYFNFTFQVKLIYDKDLSSSRQIKQLLGMGVSYTFI
jgi:hypothetical protein